MSESCNCGQHVQKLQQQISVMRKEIKNLRQLTDGAVRSHRKNLSSLQSVLTSIEEDRTRVVVPQSDREPSVLSLEKGIIQTVPIGYIESCFATKTGTPRQPTICTSSRATLRIKKAVFNNPEHSLVGLDQYSHVWIIFIFHKNGHQSYKAKVKPPRLNGLKTGVFSTRSPHRPNAIGLTLARLEKIAGDTVHLSGIDMIEGTPVLDIKPYIPDYDAPHTRALDTVGSASTEQHMSECISSDEETDALKQQNTKTEDLSGNLLALEDGRGLQEEGQHASSHSKVMFSEDKSKAFLMTSTGALGDSKPNRPCQIPREKDIPSVLAEIKSYVSHKNIFTTLATEENVLQANSSTVRPCEDERLQSSEEVQFGADSYTTIASWIREPPVSSLNVRFTPHAERNLKEFQPPGQAVPGKPSFQFLQSTEDAAAAIRGVLSADPRSVYRRTRCQDQLFHFTLDTAHITCWFGEGFAEVLRVRPVQSSECCSKGRL
ncbi:tRNA (adenine(37)-N6)-methyltransferase [Lepisosteus oculatus]|uniref:tRNA (adenine(37)-N6)-methyltransferase n=1 Tax=Lepisosteus oculatus TaxID=7918 RepID=UPI0035F520EB